MKQLPESVVAKQTNDEGQKIQINRQCTWICGVPGEGKPIACIRVICAEPQVNLIVCGCDVWNTIAVSAQHMCPCRPAIMDLPKISKSESANLLNVGEDFVI